MPLILHIEDNEGDIMLTQEAFSTTAVSAQFVVAYNGQEGLNYLRSERTKPDLILLDINMPVLNGKEFLARVKMDTKLKTIPVVILTTSESNTDIRECYNLHANAYLNKTLDFDSYLEVIRSLTDFWLKHNLYIENHN